MGASLPPNFESWTFEGGSAVARRDVAAAVRAALGAGRTLYAWAAAQEGRRTFTGRGEAYGVRLGTVAAVVRHARHGGLLAPVFRDLYVGRPRFLREAELARRLAESGVRTPAILAGVRYRAGPAHRADVATAHVEGADLVELFFGDAPPPPAGERRAKVLSAMGHLVRRLHDLSLVHPDLQLRNIVVAGGASPTAWLLDVDTCRPMRGSADAERARNLDRFYRSWAKWNALKGERLSAADRALFSAAYLEGEP